MVKKWLYPTLLLCVLALGALTFFYKLGQSSLVSWDEAWYGEIAKNILKTGNFLALEFNGSPYYDHPPAGFWLMTISMKLFGINELGVRAASAVSGLVCLILVYLLGKKLFAPAVGIASSLALISSPWFALRARSGDLDIFLIMFFLVTILLALYVQAKPKLYLPLGISMGLLFLTKSAAPLTIVPLLIVLLYGSSFKNIFKLLVGFVLITFPWIIVNYQLHSTNFIHKYFSIGLPGIKNNTALISNFLGMKVYLHNGIGTWFRPAVISIALGIILFRRKFWILCGFLFLFLIPFVFSNKGHIWHLIPAHPFLILGLFGFVYLLIHKFSKSVPWASALTLVIAIVMTISPWKKNWDEFINIPAFVSDEAILAKTAASYTEPLVIDESFVPAATFYADRHVDLVQSLTVSEIFAEAATLILITHDWRLSDIPKSDYQIIQRDRDKVLILKK